VNVPPAAARQDLLWRDRVPAAPLTIAAALP